MSPRKRTTLKTAPVITEADSAIMDGLRHQQRLAVYGVPKNTPLVTDALPPHSVTGDGQHELARIMESFKEVGRQWARTGHLSFGALVPTYAEVVDNEDGTQSFKASFFGIGATNGGYSAALAERYLREVGLNHEVRDGDFTPIELLLNRRNWLAQLHSIRAVRTALPPGRLEHFLATQDRVNAVLAYVVERQTRADNDTDGSGPSYVEPSIPTWLTGPQAQELRAYVTRRQMSGEILFGRALESDLSSFAPFLEDLFKELHELREECERPATLEDVDTWTLTRADGTRAPSPEEWLATLAANGEQHRGDAEFWLMNGLEVLASEARKAREAELTARAEKAERALERERKRRKEAEAGLSDRTIFPGSMIRYGHAVPADWARLAEQLEKGQGELFPYNNRALEVIRAQAELLYSPSQLSDMTAAEWRALHGFYRLFTGAGDDRKTFNADTLSVDAAWFYKAASVDSRRMKDRKAVFNGLRFLNRRVLPVALKVTDKKDGKRYVIGDETRLIEMKPVWSASGDGRRPLTEAEAEAIARAYAEHMDKDAPWDGPLPDRFVFTLPPLMRRISERLVLRADVLERLEAGSRAVRGQQGGLNALDHRLLIEITQREQSQHRSKDGLRARSFVDRERLLEDHYGAEKLAKWRRAGKFRERATEPFENAARALVAGGLVAHWEADYRTTAGELRDVFELVPGVVVGSESTLNDPTQTALQLRGRKARRPRAKKAAS